MIKEIFKDIEGFDNLYQISNFGRVKRLPRKYALEKILNTTSDRYGYKRICIKVNCKAKTLRIGRLVAKAFIPNPHNKPQVNHKNGVKDDDRIKNLEWVTCQENIQHAWDNGLKTRKYNIIN